MIHNLNVSYFCQAANIPKLIYPRDQNTGRHTTPETNYNLSLMIRFLIQENMLNYKELYDWLIGLVFQKIENNIKNGDKQKYRSDTHKNNN